jgi:AcrR family transcriptional regulator
LIPIAPGRAKGHIADMAKKDGYHHGDLRAGLVEAARALVETNGPEKLSLSDACRAAGVSTAAPYRHFPDKDALLFAVAQEGMERQAGMMREAASHHPLGSEASITAIGRAYVDFAMREPGVFKLMFSLTRGHADEAALVAKGEATFGIVLAQIAARTGHPFDHAQVVLTGFRLWTFVHGLSFLLIDDKLCKLDLERLVDVDAMIADTARRFLAD